MGNPWEEIPLADYEAHMSLDSVRQTQTLRHIMQSQLEAGSAGTVMILGVAGGNGLDLIAPGRFQRVYGVDVNAAYLAETAGRYPALGDALVCLREDLTETEVRLPEAELVIANLIVEYIGYECFLNVLRRVRPRYVSCVLQLNPAEAWVSESPYIRVFDGLEAVHHTVEPRGLRSAMAAAGWRTVYEEESPLPDGKRLARLDFTPVTPGAAGRMEDGLP